MGYAVPARRSTLTFVQRLFSMFPSGAPGLALLLLRLSVASSLLFEDYAHRSTLPGWCHMVVILISLVVSVGYLTPIVAAAALVCHALLWFVVGAGSGAAPLTVIFALDALALALLGPGSYSLDSRRFGRRLVVLQPP
jgi:hypothetical protein